MRITIDRAILPRDRDALVAFDRKIFRNDVFEPEDWDELEPYWLAMDGKRVGCCAFERDRDFDRRKRQGSVYIVSTGILPRYRGKGLGDRFKRWQIAWARSHGFTRIVTNSRRSNLAMIRLNKKHGFQVIGFTRRDYYSRPAEPAVIMELQLPPLVRTRSPRLDATVALLIAQRDRVERAIEALTSN